MRKPGCGGTPRCWERHGLGFATPEQRGALKRDPVAQVPFACGDPPSPCRLPTQPVAGLLALLAV